jgi:hypothetical protein
VSLLAGKDGWRPGLAIAGAVAAILSLQETILRRFLIGTEFDILIGLWFGLALAGYFAAIKRDQSIAKAVSLAVGSAAAYWLAFVTTFDLEVSYGEPHVHAVPLFVGGFVGAFVMSTTTFLLYGDSRDRMFQKVLTCSTGGGVLGVAGWQLGNAMQSGIGSEAFSTSVLFVVWQTGLGLLMGLVWPARATPPIATGVSESPALGPPDRNRVPLRAKVFMVAVVVPLAWATIGGLWTRYRMKQADAAMNAYRTQRPTLDGLPAIAARSDDQVMILTPIADHAAYSLGYHVNPAYNDWPQNAEYTVCYMNRASEQCGATPAAVDVRVTQYPTAEWALYALKGTGAVGGYGAGLGREKVVVKFGQRLLQRALLTHDTGDVYWVSGVYVVRVMSYIPNADEFIRAYLERHPSSL